MSESVLSPRQLQALKRDLFSSLRCAVPGLVESFDAETGRAAVRPLPGPEGKALPLLAEVPVFLPADIPVSPGDPCLVIFADYAFSGWPEAGDASGADPEVSASDSGASGAASAPSAEASSGRMHDLSDAFAFVGFRR